ncbi:UNVERIFIED_CONTAM: hypothetical protein Sindi_3044400, partial [Sesamum indicum]
SPPPPRDSPPPPPPRRLRRAAAGRRRKFRSARSFTRAPPPDASFEDRHNHANLALNGPRTPPHAPAELQKSRQNRPIAVAFSLKIRPFSDELTAGPYTDRLALMREAFPPNNFEFQARSLKSPIPPTADDRGRRFSGRPSPFAWRSTTIGLASTRRSPLSGQNRPAGDMPETPPPADRQQSTCAVD